MNLLNDFNVNLEETEHPIVVQSLHILKKLSVEHCNNKLNFKNELTLKVDKMDRQHSAHYNHKNKIITFNEKLPNQQIEYALYHELGHYYDQKLNDVLFKGKSIYYNGVYATDKIEAILAYGKRSSHWSDWHDFYFEREHVDVSSPSWMERVYDLLDTLEIISEQFLLNVGLDSWKEKGLNNLNFLSKWVRGVKKFNVDKSIAKEGWEKWKLSTISSFSFIPMMDEEKKQQLELWRYSWSQFIQSVEDLLFPSVSNKDYLEWNSTWSSLIKAMKNNGLTYETNESELWANGFASFLTKGNNFKNQHVLSQLPVGQDREKHLIFWNKMIKFIFSSI